MILKSKVRVKYTLNPFSACNANSFSSHCLTECIHLIHIYCYSAYIKTKVIDHGHDLGIKGHTCLEQVVWLLTQTPLVFWTGVLHILYNDV